MTKKEFFKEFNRINQQIKGLDTGTEGGKKIFHEIIEESYRFRRNFWDNLWCGR
jgi:hypothetical protein